MRVQIVMAVARLFGVPVDVHQSFFSRGKTSRKAFRQCVKG